MTNRQASAQRILKNTLKEGQTIYTSTRNYRRGKSDLSVYIVEENAITNITGLCCRALEKPLTDGGYLLFTDHAGAFAEQLATCLFDGNARALRHVDLD